MELDTDQGLKYGLMVQSMKDNGALIKQMVEVNSGMQTETSTKVCGKMIRLMDMEFMFMSTVLNTKDIGVTTCRMAQELNPGVMEASMREVIRRV